MFRLSAFNKRTIGVQKLRQTKKTEHNIEQHLRKVDLLNAQLPQIENLRIKVVNNKHYYRKIIASTIRPIVTGSFRNRTLMYPNADDSTISNVIIVSKSIVYSC